MEREHNVEPAIPNTYTVHDIYRLIEENKKLKTQIEIFKEVIEYYLGEDDGGGKAYKALLEYKNSQNRGK